ncbi:hypothetical protein GIB67_009090 [Kingdonia uniflora]|uniref:Uncharacterized protein n=1 Tax=Kingdonia uniflora TaxID=39325 RepID=A0A7J7MNS8_9MAGN|nr:hypothetical protein GIB67_009090 [Kingdonia uniflora]
MREEIGIAHTRSQRIHRTTEGRLAIKITEVWERIFGLLGYDAELPVREEPEEVVGLIAELEYGLSLPLSNLEKGIMNLIGACLVQMNGNMWEVISVCEALNLRREEQGRKRKISPEDVLQFYGVKFFGTSRGTYFCTSAPRLRFFDLNSAGRTWNDNMIWVKGPKSQVERKESLLDKVILEDTKLEVVLEDLSINRKKRVNSRIEKVLKSQQPLKRVAVAGNSGSGTATEKVKKRRVEPFEVSCGKVVENKPNVEDNWKEVAEKARLAVLREEGEKRKMAARLMKGICLRVEEEIVEQKRKMIELDRNVARLKNDLSKEGKRLEALRDYQVVEISRLANTYVEEEDEEFEDDAAGVVDGLDCVSLQMARNNKGDDIERLETETEKELRDIHLIIIDLEVELAKGRETLVSLLFLQAELRELGRLKKKLADKDNNIKGASDDLTAPELVAEQLITAFSAKDVEFWAVQRRCNKLNERVAYLKAELGQVNLHARNAEVGECSKRMKNDDRASLVQSDVVSLSARIRELEGDIAQIQGLKENVIREKVELLKKMPDVDELKKEIETLRAQVVELEATNRADSAKTDKKLVENIAITDWLDRQMVPIFPAQNSGRLLAPDHDLVLEEPAECSAELASSAVLYRIGVRSPDNVAHPTLEELLYGQFLLHNFMTLQDKKILFNKFVIKYQDEIPEVVEAHQDDGESQVGVNILNACNEEDVKVGNDPQENTQYKNLIDFAVQSLYPSCHDGATTLRHAGRSSIVGGSSTTRCVFSLEFDDNGSIIGEYRAKFATNYGELAKTLVSPIIHDWCFVGKVVNKMIWDDICEVLTTVVQNLPGLVDEIFDQDAVSKCVSYSYSHCPRADHRPIKDGALGNILIIALCNTDSPMRYVDIRIPANNKGKQSIGCLFGLLARMVFEIRGTILPGHKWDVMVDLFFYREPEETKEQEENALSGCPPFANTYRPSMLVLPRSCELLDWYGVTVAYGTLQQGGRASRDFYNILIDEIIHVTEYRPLVDIVAEEIIVWEKSCTMFI